MKRIAALAALALFLTGCAHSEALGVSPKDDNSAQTSRTADRRESITTDEEEVTTEEDTVTVTVTVTEAASAEETPTPEEEEPYDDLSALEDIINEQMQCCGASWSVYVQDLDTGAELDIDPAWYYPASLIKIFALAACYEQIEEGYINEDYVYRELEDMIEVSDNYAFNDIVWQLGAYYITDWCQQNDYEDTVQCHGLYPAYNADGLQLDIGSGFNCTTASDCGRLLASIYRGECVSEYASEQMMEILSKQENRSKIPAGLPEGVKVANKTGETEVECHDAAIVCSDGADYVLVVMIETYYDDAYSYEYNIAQLSQKVYEYFNP